MIITESDVLEIYSEYEVIPFLVVLGGSRSRGYAKHYSDYDYFGFHLDKVGNADIIQLIQWDNVFLNTMSMERLKQLLNSNDYLWILEKTINWFFDILIYINDRAKIWRDEYFKPLFEHRKSIILRESSDVVAWHKQNGGKKERFRTTGYIIQYLNGMEELRCNYGVFNSSDFEFDSQ